MRLIALILGFLIALLLWGCVGTVQPGPQPAPPIPIAFDAKWSVSVEGEMLFHPVEILGVVYTYPVRVWGNGTAYFRYPTKPNVWFEGEGGWIIEPLTPSDESAVRALVASGQMRLPVPLSPVGTIKEGQP